MAVPWGEGSPDLLALWVRIQSGFASKVVLNLESFLGQQEIMIGTIIEAL